MTIKKQRPRHRNCCLLVSLLLVLSPIFQTWVRAQTPESQISTDQKVDSLSQILRLEKTEVSGGSQLLTVHARLIGLESNKDEAEQWVPLVSILRDTLGDENRENDRLRYERGTRASYGLGSRSPASPADRVRAPHRALEHAGLRRALRRAAQGGEEARYPAGPALGRPP